MLGKRDDATLLLSKDFALDGLPNCSTEWLPGSVDSCWMNWMWSALPGDIIELMLLKSRFDWLVLSYFHSDCGSVDRPWPGLDSGSGNDSLSPMLTGESSFILAIRTCFVGLNDTFEWLLSWGPSLWELERFEVFFRPGLPNCPVLCSDRLSLFKLCRSLFLISPPACVSNLWWLYMPMMELPSCLPRSLCHSYTIKRE